MQYAESVVDCEAGVGSGKLVYSLGGVEIASIVCVCSCGIHSPVDSRKRRGEHRSTGEVSADAEAING